MQVVGLYAVTAVVFLALDVLGLNYLLRPVFERHVGHLLAETVRIGPAVAFYMFYVAGLVWFVSLPALREGSVVQAFAMGALLGAMAYGTYEFTNFATLKGWHWQMVVLDLGWGMALTGVSAAVGVAVMRAVAGTGQV